MSNTGKQILCPWCAGHPQLIKSCKGCGGTGLAERGNTWEEEAEQLNKGKTRMLTLTILGCDSYNEGAQTGCVYHCGCRCRHPNFIDPDDAYSGKPISTMPPQFPNWCPLDFA